MYQDSVALLNGSRLVLVANLGSKVESEVALTGDLVLHQERDLIGEADVDLVGQGSSLAEVDKVLERECEGDRLAQFNLDILLRLFEVGAAAEGHRAVADITVASKFDTVLGSLDHNCRSLIRSQLRNAWGVVRN
jgi:hypothetical protein